MKLLLAACSAPLQGCWLCLSDKEIRRNAIWPWAIGAVCYFASFWAVIHFHGTVIAWLAGTGGGDGAAFYARAWTALRYDFFWVLGTVLLLVAAMLASTGVTLALASVAHSRIAAIVFGRRGVPIPESAAGVRGALGEGARTVGRQAGTLLWLIPLACGTFIAGLVPVLTPFAVLVGAWLLAFQFVDVGLDVLRLGPLASLRFGLRKALPILLFGGVLSVFWAVPFLGIFLAPAAVAGGAALTSILTLQDLPRLK